MRIVGLLLLALAVGVAAAIASGRLLVPDRLNPFAPLFVILGAWTRPAALVIAINMVVAVLMAHTSQLFSLAKTGGYALELQAMYLFTAISIALLGAGRYSLAGARGRWN